ncbi:hypothetical protein [Actinophytocola sp.]|uniref:hypothetical protein n=1 Tax=Actinophytocola sp. TaxID=1872138 RepID=UPI003D6C2745
MAAWPRGRVRRIAVVAASPARTALPYAVTSPPPADAAVPAPPPGTAVVSLYVGDLRATASTIGPLPGARFIT